MCKMIRDQITLIGNASDVANRCVNDAVTPWVWEKCSQFSSIVGVEELGALRDNAISDRLFLRQTVQGPTLMTMFGVLASAPLASREAAAKAVHFIVN